MTYTVPQFFLALNPTASAAAAALLSFLLSGRDLNIAAISGAICFAVVGAIELLAIEAVARRREKNGTSGAVSTRLDPIFSASMIYSAFPAGVLVGALLALVPLEGAGTAGIVAGALVTTVVLAVATTISRRTWNPAPLLA